MRQIVIKTVFNEDGSHEVRLGNGTVHRFASDKAAKKFLAETNRFLTDVLFNLNHILSELYLHFREIWIISEEVKGPQAFSDQIQNLEHFIHQSCSRASYRAGTYFTFIDLRKFCEHGKDLVKKFRNIKYVNQTDTIRRHKLDALFTQIHGVEMQLMNYGQLKAYSHFCISKLEHISEVTSHLKIA